MKICRKCGKEKQPTDFFADHFTSDKLTPSCKACLQPKPKRVKRQLLGTTKRCDNCARMLPSGAFTYADYNPDGLQKECRTCKQYRQGKPTQAQVAAFEAELAEIYADGKRLLRNIELHRSQFEQYVYQEMRRRGLLKDWRPPSWIHKTSIPE